MDAEDERRDLYAERRREAVIMTWLGAPAKSAAAWVSEIDKAERDGRTVPTWPELEAIAPSIPTRKKA